jgi:hypothetical protein
MEINTTKTNGTTYTTTTLDIAGNSYRFTQASGRAAKGLNDYVNITKLTNNPFRTTGRDFATWDDACQAYKSGDMKAAILQVEVAMKRSHSVETMITHN